MLDWLLRPVRDVPSVAVAGRKVPVIIRRLDRSRRMVMRVASDGSEIRISMPRWGREDDALAFARQRHAWIAQQLERLRAPEAPIAGTNLPFRGQPLAIHHSPSAPRRVQASDGRLLVGGPDTGLEARLKRWLQAQARALFETDVADYAARASLPVPPLALSGAQARWGSCSAGGQLRLNWRLVMAPDAVRRSVVAHEVAHLVHFDHSPQFHALLGRLFEGDLPAANRWLKAHGRSLYGYFG